MVETPLNVSHMSSALGCASVVRMARSALEISGNSIAEIDSVDSNSDRLVRFGLVLLFFFVFVFCLKSL